MDLNRPLAISIVHAVSGRSANIYWRVQRAEKYGSRKLCGEAPSRIKKIAAIANSNLWHLHRQAS
jgi:hypothetical protein